MKSGSQIFELYGYPIDSWNKSAMDNLRICRCPFMNAECDGGGNRFSSSIALNNKHSLNRFFKNKTLIQAGVCSLQLKPNEQPWIVCPRRLLNYRTGIDNGLQSHIKRELIHKANLQKGITYLVWSEVKLKCAVQNGNNVGLFDYTFDYIITGQERKKISEIAKIIDKSPKQTLAMLTEIGFTTCHKGGEAYCENYPTYPLVIVEVMTSSTSGGNKKNRTQIAQCFEDTILKLNGANISPMGPGINYRQVWARMVSQLLVKSQIGKAWGGSTFWILQDLLVDYISSTTALNFLDFLAHKQNEVNIITGGYGNEIYAKNRSLECAQIKDIAFYAGKVSANKNN